MHYFNENTITITNKLKKETLAHTTSELLQNLN